MNKTIRRPAREVIYKVFKRCEAECRAKKILSDLFDIYKRTADMTGKSVATIRRIADEGERNGGIFSTPGKKRKGRPSIEMNNYDLCAIRQRVQIFYTMKKRVPTLRNLLPVVQKELGFEGSREHLRKVLFGLGFSFKKRHNDRNTVCLLEKKHISLEREKYLREIITNRNLPPESQKDIIYLDESYVNSSYKFVKCWESGIKGGKNKILNGKCCVMLAGGEKGFIPNALLIYNDKNKNYHSEMNHENFIKWVKCKLIPNITKPSIIVMDTAPYHSVLLNNAPTYTTRTHDIKLWLLKNNIAFDPILKKMELMRLVKEHTDKPKYEIDNILGNHGHTVVRIPRLHCDLNPTEYIWGIANRNIGLLNETPTDIKQAAEQVMSDISEKDWENVCQRVAVIERGYDLRNHTIYDDIDDVIINLEDHSSSSSSSDDNFMELDDEDAAMGSSNTNEEYSQYEMLDEGIL